MRALITMNDIIKNVALSSSTARISYSKIENKCTNRIMNGGGWTNGQT